MTLIRWLIPVAMLIAAFVIASAQERPSKPDIIQANAKRCQLNTIYIADTGAIAQTTNKRIRVVARLGAGETSHRRNLRRLADIKAEYGDNFRNGRIILTEGSRVKGPGRVEFYLGSDLYWVPAAASAETICAYLY